jgi:hypothetical protein
LAPDSNNAKHLINRSLTGDRPSVHSRQLSGEPMTEEQRSYLKTLVEQTDGAFEEGLTREQAAKRIDSLRNKLNVGTA